MGFLVNRGYAKQELRAQSHDLIANSWKRFNVGILKMSIIFHFKPDKTF